MKIDTNKTTLNSHRFKDNPLEKKFVDAWRKINTNPAWQDKPDYKLLGMLILNSNPSNEECQTAETIIQWLGLPVGQNFLKSVMELT